MADCHVQVNIRFITIRLSIKGHKIGRGDAPLNYVLFPRLNETISLVIDRKLVEAGFGVGESRIIGKILEIKGLVGQAPISFRFLEKEERSA